MVKINKLKAPPAYQLISTELQKLILEGTLKPGDPLPPEVELADRFGVNRSTVREGIRQLETEGMLSREGRKRLVVSIPGHIELAPRMTRAMVMQNVTFRELWQVASELEPMAAELAASAATEEALDRLQANVDAMAAVVDAGESPAELDMEFHSLLAEATNNKVLLLSREPVGILLYSAFEQMNPTMEPAARRNLEAHRHVLAGLAARDPIVAREWMQKHLRDLMRGWVMAGCDMDARIDPGLSY